MWRSDETLTLTKHYALDEDEANQAKIGGTQPTRVGVHAGRPRVFLDGRENAHVAHHFLTN